MQRHLRKLQSRIDAIRTSDPLVSLAKINKMMEVEGLALMYKTEGMLCTALAHTTTLEPKEEAKFLSLCKTTREFVFEAGSAAIRASKSITLKVLFPYLVERRKHLCSSLTQIIPRLPPKK